jgi:hypothetical protein
MVRKRETNETKTLKLQKSIYGLVQTARQSNKRFEEGIIELGFNKNEIVSYAFIRKIENKT